MKKNSKLYICSSCGASYTRWAGKCESCGEWNTIQEEIQTGEKFSLSKNKSFLKKYNSPIALNLVEKENLDRLSTGFSELDLVLGGGIVPGSLILLGGEPGVGKSTLLLEIAKKVSSKIKILYISGEESASQISLRARRMNLNSSQIFISSETYVDTISSMIESEDIQLVFIDSIQTLSKENLLNQAGTVTQLRECTQKLLETAKKTNIPILLIGHITKEGTIAGPKILEHIVDVVLYFDNDKNHYFRILRGIKNRFGAVGDLAVFEMKSDGLYEVIDKQRIFITTNSESRIGSCLSVVMEGSRALSVEVQALVSRTTFSQARRISEGLDNKRLILLAAVLEKFMGLKMVECDIFCNLAGGLTVDEPALDMAICSSILSSYLEKTILPYYSVIGEIGLSGEVRPVSHINLRVKEIKALGMKTLLLPKINYTEIANKEKDIELIPIETIRELEKIF